MRIACRVDPLAGHSRGAYLRQKSTQEHGARKPRRRPSTAGRGYTAMKTVLVAYEREQDLAAVETLLNTRGHRVLRARTGVEALDAARRETPQIVLSDVMLPKLDGFALCRRLKEDPVLQRIPVVLHSFRVEGPKYEVFAAEVGAERFMPRGSRIEDLVSFVDEQQTGSGTVRMPVLVPELLERREQDRRRVQELERRVAELETANGQLRGAEQELREARDAREAAQRQLEEVQRQLAQQESKARRVADESRGELARVSLLETRLAEAQAARTRAQAAADDAERPPAAQPLRTRLCDME